VILKRVLSHSECGRTFLKRKLIMHSIRLSVFIALCFCLKMGMAISNPPYEVYPHVAEVTDNPPVNYMKVCEPGRSGETNASYVVLGISFPRTYQAVSADYDGDLIVPAYIDGLPVRKVNEAAFVACSKLRSVRIPSTVREVGSRAVAEYWLLTNIIFETGVSTIGNAAFSN
jgi:hypothetical protein